MGLVNKRQAEIIGYIGGNPVFSVSGGHDVFELDSASFRARNDDGSETAATWIAAADTNWTQDVDVNFRVRFLVQEVGAGTLGGSWRSSTGGITLYQYRLNAGTWTYITTSSSVVQFALSSHFAQADATTQQLGSGTFVAGQMDETGAGSQVITLSGDDETEGELCVQIVGADVSNSDTIEIRPIGEGSAGTVLTNYTLIPSITANKAGGSIIPHIMYHRHINLNTN